MENTSLVYGVMFGALFTAAGFGYTGYTTTPFYGCSVHEELMVPSTQFALYRYPARKETNSVRIPLMARQFSQLDN